MKPRITVVAYVLFVFLFPFVGVRADDLPNERERSPWQSFDPGEYTESEGWLTLDRNGDGVVDYAVMVNERGHKRREAIDFNRDGLMDDFYFYENDVLQRQEIDTWVYLRRGVYIEMWERDRDFDGVIDERERYGSSSE